jgi:hypothetical protein
MPIKPLYEFDEEWRRRIVKMHLEMQQGGEVTGPIEDAFGEVYSITLPESTSPSRIAAKCPRIKRFGTLDQARTGFDQLLHELEKAHSVFMVPWVNRFSDVQIIHGWPFILSNYRDGSLEDLIANPLAWSLKTSLRRSFRLSERCGWLDNEELPRTKT